MSIAATVFRSNRMPFIALACVVVAIFFVLQALLMIFMGMAGLAILSIVVAAVFGLGALWLYRISRASAVVVNPTQFIVKSGKAETAYDRDQIDSIDLRSLRGQLTMKDGSNVWLPLEGNDLIEASILLSPR